MGREQNKDETGEGRRGEGVSFAPPPRPSLIFVLLPRPISRASEFWVVKTPRKRLLRRLNINILLKFVYESNKNVLINRVLQTLHSCKPLEIFL